MQKLFFAKAARQLHKWKIAVSLQHPVLLHLLCNCARRRSAGLRSTHQRCSSGCCENGVVVCPGHEVRLHEILAARHIEAESSGGLSYSPKYHMPTLCERHEIFFCKSQANLPQTPLLPPPSRDRFSSPNETLLKIHSKSHIPTVNLLCRAVFHAVLPGGIQVANYN